MSASVSRITRTVTTLGVALSAALLVASCSSGKTYEGVAGTATENRDTIFSNGGVGLTLFGGSKENAAAAAPVAVNAYLWRASLDTLAFMPLASADPFGGVIISEWYAPNETPDERFKVNVYILGPTLRADGIRISIFRQTRSGGVWSDAAVNAEMTTEFENAVLSRARDLRLRAVAEKN